MTFLLGPNPGKEVLVDAQPVDTTNIVGTPTMADPNPEDSLMVSAARPVIKVMS